LIFSTSNYSNREIRCGVSGSAVNESENEVLIALKRQTAIDQQLIGRMQI
jgi:hypothetical protein